MYKIKNKKGASEILQILILFTIITFILFFPIATYTINQRSNMLEDTKTLGLQMLSRQGQLTQVIKDTIIADLAAKGFDTSGVIIKSSTDTTGVVYRDNNTPMWLEIYVPATGDVKFLQTLWNLVGLKRGMAGYAFGGDASTYYYYTKGYILSERIQ